jgi:hypothetical protein
LQPEGWNVGFDEFYSMLFTGPSGLPVLNVTALQSPQAKRGPESGRFDEREDVA